MNERRVRCSGQYANLAVNRRNLTRESDLSNIVLSSLLPVREPLPQWRPWHKADAEFFACWRADAKVLTVPRRAAVRCGVHNCTDTHQQLLQPIAAVRSFVVSTAANRPHYP